MRSLHEKGLRKDSELYILTASRLAEKVFYYPDRIGHYYCDDHYVIDRSYYPSFFLAYVLKGTLSVTFRGSQTSVTAGHCCLIDCREPHIYRSVGNAEFIWIHFAGANTSDFFEQIYKREGISFVPGNPSFLKKQILGLLSSLDKGREPEERSLSVFLHELLCDLLYNSHTSSERYPVIAEAKQYLRDHISENQLIPEVARLHNMSNSQFNRIFRSGTGQSPYEFLLNIRINEAKILLKETDLSVTEIAGRVGYDYATSFEAAFKRKTGISPLKYRAFPL